MIVHQIKGGINIADQGGNQGGNTGQSSGGQQGAGGQQSYGKEESTNQSGAYMDPETGTGQAGQGTGGTEGESKFALTHETKFSLSAQLDLSKIRSEYQSKPRGEATFDIVYKPKNYGVATSYIVPENNHEITVVGIVEIVIVLIVIAFIIMAIRHKK